MKTIRKPDLNAPRFKEKRISVLTLDTYKKFILKYPKYKHITVTQFKDIVKTFNANIAEGITENRNGVELPEGLGFIFMGSCPKSKQKNIDYKKSLEFGVEAVHKNWDSDNRLLKIFYTNVNTKYPFRNKQVWAFKAVKQFRKAASDAFKEDWLKYIEVEPTEKISAMFDKYRKKEYVKNLKPIVPEGYNEFDLN
jgi:hypothetical protein